MHLPRVHVRLNDRERTLGLIVLLSLFLGFNYLFLLPRIDRWKALSKEMAEAQRRLSTLQEAIARHPDWQARIRELEPFIARATGRAADSETKLQDLASRLTSKHGITVDRIGRVVVEESPTFRALRLDINFKDARTAALVDFLHELHSQPGLIEVRSLTVNAARMNPRDPRVEGDLVFASLLPRRERIEELVKRVPGLATMVPETLPASGTQGAPATAVAPEPETEADAELAVIGLPDLGAAPAALPGPDQAEPDAGPAAAGPSAGAPAGPAGESPPPIAPEQVTRGAPEAATEEAADSPPSVRGGRVPIPGPSGPPPPSTESPPPVEPLPPPKTASADPSPNR